MDSDVISHSSKKLLRCCRRVCFYSLAHWHSSTEPQPWKSSPEPLQMLLLLTQQLKWGWTWGISF